MFVRDLRHASRALSKSPGFAAAAILTLALGIGANTAIFSVAHSVLLKPLPYPDPNRIVEVSEVDRVGRRMNVADPNFRDLRDRNRCLGAYAEWNAGPVSVSGGSEPVRVVQATVGGQFFHALGVQPELGRSFAPEELQSAGPAAVVVSYGFWQRYLSSQRDLSRLSLRFEEKLYRVVGVMPRGFQFPEDTQLWAARRGATGPAGELGEGESSRTAHNWRTVGRLRDGVSLAAAQADLQAIAGQIRREHGDRVDLFGAAAVPLKDALVGRVRPALVMLLAAAIFLMLVAGANVTNLALARATARRRELAIRAALGASRADLLGIVFAEILLLALAGSAAAVLLSWWSMGAVRALSGASLPRADEIAVDPVVLAFAVGLAVLAAFVVSVTTTRAGGRAPLTDLGSGREGASTSRETMRSQSVLLAVQAGMTALLLAGLALFARSFLHVLQVEPGFHAEGALAMDLFPPYPASSADKARRSAEVDELVHRLASVPGVQSVGAVGSLPLGSDMADGTFLLLGSDQPPTRIEDFERLARDPARSGYANYCPATGSYFATMGIPLLRGRLFDDRDTFQSPPVAIISQALARQKFADRDPIGQRIEFGNMDGDLRPLTVVGVVGDVRPRRLEQPPEPIFYVSFLQRPQAAAALTTVIRFDANPASVAQAARQAARALEPTLPSRIRPLDEVVSSSLAARRFSLTLLAFFGVLALCLAAAGIASVTSFAVARRTSEIGIRLALGAKPEDVLRLFLARSLRVIAVGGGAGLLLAALLARLLQSQLYDVAPLDPWSFAASAAVLLAVGVAACAAPAFRATRIDPLAALRSE